MGENEGEEVSVMEVLEKDEENSSGMDYSSGSDEDGDERGGVTSQEVNYDQKCFN